MGDGPEHDGDRIQEEGAENPQVISGKVVAASVVLMCDLLDVSQELAGLFTRDKSPFDKALEGLN
jgi:hypothetical protein